MRFTKLIAREHTQYYELDRETHLLFGSDGRRIKLSQTEYAVLSRLAKTPSTPVKIEELLDAGWKHPERQELSVSRTISDLRKKLGDTGTAKRFIATIPNFGYELIANCEDRDGPPHPPPLLTIPLTRALAKANTVEPISSAADSEQSKRVILDADPEDLSFTEFTVKLSDTWPSFLQWLAGRLNNMSVVSIREDQSRVSSFYHSGKPGNICYPIEILFHKSGVPIIQRLDLVSEWLHPFALDLAAHQAGIPWDTSLFPVKELGTETESRIEESQGNLRDAEYRILFAVRRSSLREEIRGRNADTSGSPGHSVHVVNTVRTSPPDEIESAIEGAETYESTGDVWSAATEYEKLSTVMEASGDARGKRNDSPSQKVSIRSRRNHAGGLALMLRLVQAANR